jgi:hypothetical protein
MSSIRVPVNSTNTSEEEDAYVTSSDTHHDLALHGGRGRSSAGRLVRYPASTCRVSVQDLEGDCNGTILLLLPQTLDDLLMMVSSRFGYKHKYCRLFSKYGAVIEDLTLLKDDDLLFASDGSEFPQQMREAASPGLGMIPKMNNHPSSNLNVQNLHSLERYDIWYSAATSYVLERFSSPVSVFCLVLRTTRAHQHVWLA